MRSLTMNRLLAISLCVLLLTGCSRTVTTMPSLGTQMTVNATFRGNIDLTKNRYLMIISTAEAFNIPILPPEGTSLDEFLEPGDSPVIGNIADYYTKYYSTWNSYVVLDSLGYSFAKGPFSAASPASRESFASITSISNQISFVLRLDKIFASIPDTIYFDIISVDYPTGAQKYLKDHIAPPTQSISKISGSLLSKSDEVKSDIDPSLDIISWSVKIE